MRIREYRDEDLEELVQVTLRAFEPIFDSFKQVLGQAIYPLVYPDWRKTQKETVVGICKDQEKHEVLVAEEDGKGVGFLAFACNKKARSAEVVFLAVNPDHQDLGIGTKLNTAALQRMKREGMEIVHVGTGGDDGHIAARRSYEKAGYTGLPLVRYYKKL